MAVAIAPSTTLHEQVGAFVAFMRREERSERTVEAYLWALKPFLAYLEENHVDDFSGVDRDLLERWQDEITAKWAPRSRSLAVTAVRMFFTWAAKREKCDAKLALFFDKVKLQALQPRPLKNDALLKIKVHYLNPNGDPVYLRNRALFNYIMGVGCRVSEALQVQRKGFERVRVVQKGGTYKQMVCPDFAAELIRAYLKTRIDDNPLLWVTHPGKSVVAPMDPQGVRDVWRQLAKDLGVSYFTTHQLRHTAATAMLAAGEDPLTVSTFLGHKNLATLKIYAATPEATRARATAAMNRFLES